MRLYKKMKCRTTKVWITLYDCVHQGRYNIKCVSYKGFFPCLVGSFDIPWKSALLCGCVESCGCAVYMFCVSYKVCECFYIVRKCSNVRFYIINFFEIFLRLFHVVCVVNYFLFLIYFLACSGINKTLVLFFVWLVVTCPQCQVVSEELHDECGIFVALFR